MTLRWFHRLSRQGASSQLLGDIIWLAKDRGVTFKRSDRRGRTFANQAPGAPSEMCHTTGWVYEYPPGSAKYHVEHYSDARRSDIALMANTARVLARDGLPWMGTVAIENPNLIRTGRKGHKYIVCARPLSDYHHMELRAIAAIPDAVPDGLLGDATGKGVGPVHALEVVQDSHAPVGTHSMRTPAAH